MSRSAREQARALLATEVAYYALTLAAAISFCRLFIGWSFLPPLVLAATASHLLAAGCRRQGWNVALGAIVSVAGLSVLVTLAFYRSTSFFGLPTMDTWNTMRTELQASWDQFAHVKALVPATGGYLVAATIAVWFAAFLADTFAFRALAAVEAILPSGILFVFASALGADRLRFAVTALWLAAALLAYALHRAMAADGGGWLAGIRRGTIGAIGRTAAVLGIAVIPLALLLGPALPGAGQEALLDTKRSGDGTRQTVSPLVDIQGRIVDRSDVELFSVQSTVKSYWRLTALEQFDGRLWTSERSYGDADGELGGGLPDEYTVEGDQTFTIEGLDAIWLPAAYSPERIETDDEVRYDDDSSSLVTRRDDVQPGTTYQVISRVPVLNADQLRQVTAPPPDNMKDYLQLPGSFPNNLRRAAVLITQAGTTQYDKMKALQDYFQQFTYDLSVQRGHSTNAIENFLLARRGYCEQFAGTFAAFARSLGIPARVAVGFTPGELLGDGKYHVLGKHAHAWPEVYFTGIGWVPFEPTPSRGLPGAEAYTGVPAAQEGEAPTAPVVTIPGTAAPAQVGNPDQISPDVSLPQDVNPIDLGLGGSTPSDDSSPLLWLLWIAVAIVVMALLAGLWLLLVPRLVRARWDRRRRAAQTGADQVLVSWREATEVLDRGGTPAQPSETPLEFADRLTEAGDRDADLVRTMAGNVTVAAYSRDDVSEDVVGDTDEARRTLEERRWNRATWKERLWWRADPRPLLRSHEPATERQDEDEPVGAR